MNPHKTKLKLPLTDEEILKMLRKLDVEGQRKLVREISILLKRSKMKPIKGGKDIFSVRAACCQSGISQEELA